MSWMQFVFGVAFIPGVLAILATISCWVSLARGWYRDHPPIGIKREVWTK